MNPEQFKQIGVLRSMETDALASLVTVLEEQVYRDGQIVFTEGNPGDGMYFIVEGRIRIEKRTQAGGQIQKTLAVLSAGDHFGEMALLNHKPRAASALADGTARVLRLSRAAFEQIHKKNSASGLGLLFGMIQTASERIRWLDTQLVAYDEIGKAIGEALDLRMLLELILEQVSSASGADWSFVALRSEFTGRLDPLVQRNLTLTPALLESVSKGEGFLAPILSNAQDLLTPNVNDEPLLSSCPRLGFETASLLVTLIVLGGQILGIIVLGGLQLNQFNINTLNLAKGIGRQAAQAILNHRRREEEDSRSQRSRSPYRS
jgi:CRP-like cAMP-binding protein